MITVQYLEMLRQHYGLSKKALCQATGLTLSKYNTVLKGRGSLKSVMALIEFYELNSIEVSILFPGTDILDKLFDLFYRVDTPVSVCRKWDSIEEGRILKEQKKKAILNKLSLGGVKTV